MTDMGRLAFAKQGLQKWICENALIKALNESPNRLFPAGMFEKLFHAPAPDRITCLIVVTVKEVPLSAAPCSRLQKRRTSNSPEVLETLNQALDSRLGDSASTVILVASPHIARSA
jgi:hypothetical protein